MNKEYRKTSELRLWDKNPRSIKGADFERLKSQIKKLGQYKPLLINKDNVVLGGNMRLRAYLDMGIDDVWVSVVDAQTEKEMVEYALSDNDRAGYYDEEVLAELVLSVPDLDLLQFKVDLGDAIDLKVVIDKFGPTPEVVEDEVPEDIETRCREGDLWQLGNHRLMCGDSTKIEDVERLMDGKKSDMVFTDPPYNIDYEGKTKKRLKIENDKKSGEEFYQFLYDSLSLMNAFSKAGAPIYVCHADSERVNFNRAMIAAGWLQKQCIIWDKGSMVLGRQDYHWEHEPILYGWKEGQAHQFFGGRDKTTIWRIPRPTRSEEHPTMKPIKLCATAIQNSSKGDDIVMDLFGGSGSTLMACEQTNRTCYMMELDPHYCDVIIQRWENFTGKEAVKL